ncbi:hypothetical protein F751_4371 [Auxenochlorella protothecoides]|uniref:Uncharacterized protein n=1 Tax=Auxenochlorella protothecoides TaxID=3075 RepID=A0A087SCN5_AUXPR|nr:hypothetical protein F751_4371 [Auxenochlorella protothecoides]KFM23489.1 hypothetical protein F751_4371 [Auxenochlorella protothecoides]
MWDGVLAGVGRLRHATHHRTCISHSAHSTWLCWQLPLHRAWVRAIMNYAGWCACGARSFHNGRHSSRLDHAIDSE